MKVFLFALLTLFFFIEDIEAQCGGGSQHQYLDINNVKALISNCDNLWWDGVDTPNYEIPKGGGNDMQLYGGLWIGGLDQNNQLHVAANTYRQNGVDFFPGPLNSSGQTNSTTCSQYDSLWKINKSTIDSFITAFANAGGSSISPSLIPASILFWPGHDNPNNQTVGNCNAPFFDVGGSGIYDPIYGDYPVIKGDQDIFWVFNDAGGAHTESGGLPLGIEIHAEAYAYISSLGCDVSNTTFYYYDIENKSSNEYHSLYVALWGDFTNNYPVGFLGCDSINDMAFIYQPDTSTKGVYGKSPPVMGAKVLKAASTDSALHIPLSGMMYYNNDFTAQGNPDSAVNYYNYMKSIWLDGSPLTYGGFGYGGSSPVKYVFTNSPSDSAGWSECSVNKSLFGDRRSLLNSGPFYLKPGGHIYLSYALIFNQVPISDYPCPSFSTIDSLASCVQEQFSNGSLNVENVNSINGFSLQPNPASSILIITCNQASPKYEVAVYDMLGRKMNLPIAFEGNKINMNVTSLAVAVYVISIRDAEGNIAVKKFVKD